MTASPLIALLFTGSFLTGCATGEVCVKPVGNLNLTPANVAAGGRGDVVSWGGVILDTRNRKTDTELDIMATPLDACGRPATHGQTHGRFLARHSGYLEPADYRVGRQVTVTGRILDVSRSRHAGAQSQFPVLEDTTIRLWPQPPTENVVYSAWPVISIGIGGGSGHLGGGVGMSF